jgi:hypothetical protein
MARGNDILDVDSSAVKVLDLSVSEGKMTI